MTERGKLSLDMRASESTEELEKEENGLLADDKKKRQNKEATTAVVVSTRTSTSIVTSRTGVQCFLYGFLTNLMLVVIVVLLLRVYRNGYNSLVLSETGSDPSKNTVPIPIERPLFLNDTTSFAFLLDKNGGFSYAADYFLLQQGLEAQVNQAYCGVATVTAVLNSFRSSNNVTLPVDYEYDPYPYATQEDLYGEDCVTQHVVLRDDDFDGIFAFPYGLGMGQVTALTQCFFRSTGDEQQEWQVQATHVDPEHVSLDQMRSDLIAYIKEKDARVMINFQRSVVHEEGGGHWSPIGAYAQAIDAFLLLDVAKYKYPATWVPTTMLYQAMATKDSCGIWDFPLGQSNLPDDLLYPETSHAYKQAAKTLHCQETYRGYLGVRRTS